MRIYRCLITLPEGKRIEWNNLTEREARSLWNRLTDTFPSTTGFGQREAITIEWGVMP